MTVPERAVGDCHPRQTVWLRADEPRACGSPPPYDLAGDSRVPVFLHGFGGIKKRPSRTMYNNRIVTVPGIAIGGDGSDVKAGYAATFASEAGMEIRANHVRGAVYPIPRHARVAGNPAGIAPSVRWYKKTPPMRTPGAAARHNAECRDLPRHYEMVRGDIKHHLSPSGTDACTGRNDIQNSERTGRPNDLWSASYLTGC